MEVQNKMGIFIYYNILNISKQKKAENFRKEVNLQIGSVRIGWSLSS